MTEGHDIYPPGLGERRVANEPDPTLLKAEARELFVKRVLMLIAAVLVVMMVGGTAVGTFLIRNQQTDRAPITDGIAKNTAVIQGCTTPGEKCYERSQKQLRDAISQLNQFGALVAACSSGGETRTYEQVVRCVQDRAASLPPLPEIPR